ncbi:MAG: type IV secretion system protein [Polyangiaceae bacterium]|jgi:type IV secretion system protein TrbL
MNFNTLTLTLQNFIAAFSGGYSRLQGSANSLLGILVGIEVVLLGLWTALGGGDNVVGVFKKILHIGAWVWIVQSYPTLCKAFVDSLVQAGLLAGGGGDVTLIMDPSRLAGYGLDATAPLTQKLGDLGMTDLSDMLVYGFGYLAILACFLMMAINVFLAVLEYYLFAALVGIFLPFGLLTPTKFLAEKAVGAVVSASVKLMVLAFVTAVINPVLSNIHFAGPEITFNELWSVFLTVCALMFFCWKAPHLAASLLGGTPHLGADHLLQAAGAPIAAGMAMSAIGRSAMAGVAATRAAASAGQTMSGSRSPTSSAASHLGTAGSPLERTGAEGAAGKEGAAAAAASTPLNAGASSTLVQSAMGKTTSWQPPAAGAGPSATQARGTAVDILSGADAGPRVANFAASATTGPERTPRGFRQGSSPAGSSTSPSTAPPEPPNAA